VSAVTGVLFAELEGDGFISGPPFRIGQLIRPLQNSDDISKELRSLIRPSIFWGLAAEGSGSPTTGA
jgi:hypothetical protein